jgi:cysteinyl-tRNA synthetase
VNNLGADILRLWIAGSDYTGEMTVSEEILKRSADSYRRIRNTMRFIFIENCSHQTYNIYFMYFTVHFTFCNIYLFLFDDISRYFQQYFRYIMAVSFIGGGNRSTWRNPPTCHKSLTNFIT